MKIHIIYVMNTIFQTTTNIERNPSYCLKLSPVCIKWEEMIC